MNSLFNISLREKRGLVYTVESTMATYNDATVWSVYYGCAERDVAKCSKLIFSQLQRLQQRPLSNTVLNNAKRQLKGQIALSHQQKENFAIDMAKQYLHKGTLHDSSRLYSKIDEVTPQTICLLTENILSKENLFTLVYS